MKSRANTQAVSISTGVWELTLLTVGSFAIPFFVGHPQIAVGVAVNSALFLSAALLPFPKRFAIITGPSIAVLLRGVIFGPNTIFLAYFIPFIWMANLLLTLVFELFNKRLGFLPGVAGAAVAKYVFLFAAARFAYQNQLVPQLFLQTMGSVQLVTALVGGAIAYGIYVWLQKAKKYSK